MPIRKRDIFQEIPTHLSSDINPYLGKMIDSRNTSQQNIYFGEDLRTVAGNWRGNLGVAPNKPLLLEVGMHTGKCILGLARNHPDFGVVGMDITFKRVCVSAEKARLQNLTNGAFVYGDASYVAQIFAPGELAGVLLFFPDPWKKKKRQQHNRLMNQEFCQAVEHLLQNQGFFWVKTDDQDYYTAMTQILQASNLTEQKKPLPFGIEAEHYESYFENLYRRQGLPIYESVWVKNC